LGYVKLLLTNNAVNRKIIKSQNNGSTIGIFYFAAINKKMVKEIDDEIDDNRLPPCLKIFLMI
jgi:hypothetical protein